jgi:vacuolar-type H+-ATPase subunit E/Vma4
LLKSHNQELALGDLAEIRKKNAFEEAEEPETEAKERTMTAAKLTARSGLINPYPANVENTVS